MLPHLNKHNVYREGGGRLHAGLPCSEQNLLICVLDCVVGSLGEVRLDFRVQYGGKIVSVDPKGSWKVRTRAV